VLEDPPRVQILAPWQIKEDAKKTGGDTETARFKYGGANQQEMFNQFK
jgi:hypothetical protein